MRAAHRSACAPHALKYALGCDYDAAVDAIRAAGGDYDAPTSEALHRALSARRHVRRTVSYPDGRRPNFWRWRKGVRGECFLIVLHTFGAHAIHLKDGQARDNGWVRFMGCSVQLAVCAVWEL